MERDSMVFYRSFMEATDYLPPESYKKVFQMVFLYAFDGVEPLNDQSIEFSLFTLIRPQIDANNTKYINGCKGGEYGHLGGAPKGNQNARKQPQNNPKTTPKQPLNNPKTTPNDNDNVNDNENVNENETENGTENGNVKPFGKEKLTKRKFFFSPCPELNDAMTDFMEHRAKIRKPMTQRAAELTIKKLEQMDARPEVQAEILRQSIREGWQGVFPLKAEPKTTAGAKAGRLDWIDDIEMEEIE